MSTSQMAIAFVGRLGLSLVFLASGLNKIFHWQETQQYLANTLSFWIDRCAQYPWALPFLEIALVSSSVLLLLATICELLGGLLVLLGLKPRFGAFLLIIFMVVTTLLFHNFWMFTGPERDVQTINFMKNVAIMGGLFILLAHGNGPRRFFHSIHPHHAPPPPPSHPH